MANLMGKEEYVDMMIKRAGLEDIVDVYDSAVEIRAYALSTREISGGYHVLYTLMLQAVQDGLTMGEKEAVKGAGISD